MLSMPKYKGKRYRCQQFFTEAEMLAIKEGQVVKNRAPTSLNVNVNTFDGNQNVHCSTRQNNSQKEASPDNPSPRRSHSNP